ncbi:MAG: polysaccharide biosynthesis protein [Betaproteobacteria bacterium]|nr:polysaccharide biosynthesis protein [Betaproteobacteria bacterium]
MGNKFPRIVLVMLHDVVASLIAWIAAYWLRFNLTLPGDYFLAATEALPWVVTLQTVIFWRFGLYRGIWRFASLPDLKRILQAIGVAAIAIPSLFVLLRIQASVPRSVLILDPLLLLLIMGGSRFFYRAWKEHHLAGLLKDVKPVLVLGAGSAADFLLRDLARTPSGYQVVGLLDDHPEKIGRHIQGVNVLGKVEDLEKWALTTEVQDVILAMPSASHSVRKGIADRCAVLGLNVLTTPSLEDIMEGRVSVSALRKIELDDLLGRDPVRLDNEGLQALLTGRTVMVTGAGGSIGSEMCRQIAHFQPSRLLLFERGEFALYLIEQEFRAAHPRLHIECLVGDIADEARMRQVMREFRPAVVFHAAAYKHVPLMEERNAFQALRNNVVGTWVVAKEARDAGVEKFVMISTDKAVNPTNVMGATKRLAEMVCQSLQRPEGARFVSVRFGNVLGSSGSVIPKFQKQIETGGPITVTHPDITRYFMSIPEAAQLVLQAGLMGQGGEIFVLDMGEPVRIAELARLMIRLAGKSEEEIRIEYTGLRPGEKLYEELLADDESTLPTPHAKLRVAQARLANLEQVDEILNWIRNTPPTDDVTVRARIKEWVPEYIQGGA